MATDSANNGKDGVGPKPKAVRKTDKVTAAKAATEAGPAKRKPAAAKPATPKSVAAKKAAPRKRAASKPVATSDRIRAAAGTAASAAASPRGIAIGAAAAAIGLIAGVVATVGPKRIARRAADAGGAVKARLARPDAEDDA